ncbi:hypothetical protein AHAS_Ahas08G0101400 [Arachis hypogaea]
MDFTVSDSIVFNENNLIAEDISKLEDAFKQLLSFFSTTPLPQKDRFLAPKGWGLSDFSSGRTKYFKGELIVQLKDINWTDIAFTLFNPRPPLSVESEGPACSVIMSWRVQKIRPEDLPTESETVIPYVHSMKQAHKILRTVISPRLICSKLLRYLQQLQLGQWQLTILGWLQIRILPWHYYL